MLALLMIMIDNDYNCCTAYDFWCSDKERVNSEMSRSSLSAGPVLTSKLARKSAKIKLTRGKLTLVMKKHANTHQKT